MKILVESKLINHAWQHVMDSGPANESKAKAVEILSSILRKEDNAENDVEKLLYDLELKYLRLLDKDGLSRLVNVLRDIQGLRTKLGLKSITDDITLEDEINQQLASYNPWHNPTNKPSDITDEDRKWADKEIEKHDDSQIPTRSKEQNIQAIKDSLAKDQGKIFPSYIPIVKEADHNKRPVEFNPPCAEYCIPEVEKIMEREVCNHRAILEILDMLSEHKNYNNELSYTIGCKAETLKAKLVGKK